ncbi:MAG: hypothetical protein CSYNP_03330 [Syntrophus sp. SKADARSKE-3]|nr:hypothetical protein [Syntrophus sp. SKADARSKE-3]
MMKSVDESFLFSVIVRSLPLRHCWIPFLFVIVGLDPTIQE